ncbi:MAG TPA: GTP-binding protein, partial [Candidatus Nanoarchaeia archaeon]|nr:GTP-binding protein [Candidatus Nanoarchaeia archaeon]
MIRSLICTFVGHVDHGKTSVQDYIRETSIVAREPGRITQHITASKIPSTVISKISQGLIDPKKLRINSLIFLDTPGHASFTNLRRRGGNLADIAVLVVDINEGFKPQTIEAIEILKNYKTPFIIAANKIDLINGYRSIEGGFLTNFQKQHELVMKTLEEKLYKIVASISTFNLNAERFDRVDDYTKQVAIVPISAKTGEGIPELLAVLVGLAQKFLEKELEIDVKNPGKATVLEVTQVKGKGTIIEAILYDGSISEKDTIVIGGIEKPVVTKVKAIYQQLPLRA